MNASRIPAKSSSMIAMPTMTRYFMSACSFMIRLTVIFHAAVGFTAGRYVKRDSQKDTENCIGKLPDGHCQLAECPVT